MAAVARTVVEDSKANSELQNTTNMWKHVTEYYRTFDIVMCESWIQLQIIVFGTN